MSFFQRQPYLETRDFHLGGVCYYSRASDYGLMKIDDKGRVLYFNEKPKGADLKSMVCVELLLNHITCLTLVCKIECVKKFLANRCEAIIFSK